MQNRPVREFCSEQSNNRYWNIEDFVLTSKTTTVTDGKHFDVQPSFWDKFKIFVCE